MNRNEEKNHVYSMMQDITNERSRLTDVYVSLLGRLNELDKVEQPVKAEEKPKKDSDDIGDDEEETQKKEEDSLSSDASPLISLDNAIVETQPIPIIEENIPTQSMVDIVNRHNSQLGNELVIERANIIPKIEIEKEKDKLPKKSSTLDSDKVTGYIVTVLKKAGKPLSARDIHAKVNDMSEYEIKKANFTSNLLPRAVKKNKRIEKATFGYYQYSTTV